MQILRGLEEWGRERVLGVFARLISTPETTARQAGESLSRLPSPRILLIGIYQNMGQFLCTTPLIRAFKAAWPGASLHFLGNPVNAAAAGANRHLDHVMIWKKSAFWEWLGQVRKMRRERFDLALLLTTERHSATGVLMARAFGARWVAGYVPSDPGPSASHAASLCHIRIPFEGEKNEVEKYLGLARAFGVPPKGAQPELVPPPEDEAAAKSILAGQKFPAKGPLIGLFIGGKANRSDRLWPVSHFVRLAESLKEAGFRVVVISPPPPEHSRLEEFRQTLGWECPVFQDPSVLRVAAFLKQLDLLVCPDGGILHLAASVGTPTIGLFFSTDPEVWSHDMPQSVLDGRGKPSAELLPENVASEVARFLEAPARL